MIALSERIIFHKCLGTYNNNLYAYNKKISCVCKILKLRFVLRFPFPLLHSLDLIMSDSEWLMMSSVHLVLLNSLVSRPSTLTVKLTFLPINAQCIPPCCMYGYTEPLLKRMTALFLQLPPIALIICHYNASETILSRTILKHLSNRDL